MKWHRLPKEMSLLTAQAFPGWFSSTKMCQVSKTITQTSPNTATFPTLMPQALEAASFYLQTPSPRPRGGTNLSPWPCPGGASGQDPHTWTYPIRTHRRTRTHLNRNKARASDGWPCGAQAAAPRARGTSYGRPPAPSKMGESTVQFSKRHTAGKMQICREATTYGFVPRSASDAPGWKRL